MNHPGIYRIWNTKTNRSYIGSSTTNCGTRIRNHFYRLRLRKHHSPLMQTDWLEHGDGSFMWEVLDRCEASACDAKEREFIDKFNSLDPMLGYNVNAASALPPSGKKRGRPKLGNVLFARRVSPAMKDALERFVKQGGAVVANTGFESVPQIEIGPVGVRAEISYLKDDNRRLLEDVDKLTKQNTDLKDRLERCAKATDDQKAVYWKDRALKAEAVHAARSEFDQT